MHNGTEKNVVVSALAGLCALGAVTAIVPVIGYVLLVLVLSGVLALLIAGLVALYATRYQPPEVEQPTSVSPARKGVA